jgi:hypothetical protein
VVSDGQSFLTSFVTENELLLERNKENDLLLERNRENDFLLEQNTMRFNCTAMGRDTLRFLLKVLSCQSC